MDTNMTTQTSLSDRYAALLQERFKLDKWFNKYLDLFSDKMTISEKSDPVWKLYNAKSLAYSEVSKHIKTTEYFLREGSRNV